MGNQQQRVPGPRERARPTPMALLTMYVLSALGAHAYQAAYWSALLRGSAAVAL